MERIRELKLNENEFEILKALLKEKLDEFNSEEKQLKEDVPPNLIKGEIEYKKFLDNLYKKFR